MTNTYATEYKADENNEGYHRAVCPVEGCGALDTITESHDANTYVVPESEAFCPKHGYVGEIQCSKCGTTIKKDQRKKMWMQSKEPTCTEPGYSVGAYLCNVTDEAGNACGNILTGKLEPTGHKFSETWTHISENGSEYHVKYCTADGCEAIDNASKKEVNFTPTADSIYKVNGNGHYVSCSGYDECREFSKELVKHVYPEYRNVEKTNDPDAEDNQKFVKECACGHKIYKTSLNDALSDAKNTTNKELILNNQYTVKGNVTIPKDVTLHITSTGNLTCDSKNEKKYTINNNGKIVKDEGGQICKNLTIVEPPNDEETEKLTKDVNGFDSGLKSNENPLLTCLKDVKYDSKTNTITFDIKKECSNKDATENLAALLVVQENGVPFINKIFKGFAENATKAEVLIEGQSKKTAEIQKGNDTNLILIMNSLFTEMSGKSNSIISQVHFSDVKNKQGVVRFYYYDEENDFEYYVDYTIAFGEVAE